MVFFMRIILSVVTTSCLWFATRSRFTKNAVQHRFLQKMLLFLWYLLLSVLISVMYSDIYLFIYLLLFRFIAVIFIILFVSVCYRLLYLLHLSIFLIINILYRRRFQVPKMYFLLMVSNPSFYYFMDIYDKMLYGSLFLFYSIVRQYRCTINRSQCY